MVHLLTLFTTAIFAAAAVSAQQKKLQEVLTDIHGPLDKWIPIKLIDVFPDAKIDGIPANDSIIYSYEPPAGASSAQLQLASNLLSSKLLTNSFSIQSSGDPECYNSGSWVFQNQLFSAKSQFCNDAATRGLDNVHGYATYLFWWLDERTNNYVPFTRNDGSTTAVFFWINVNPGFSFNWDVCFGGFWTLIAGCRGDNPDSAGGELYNFNNGQIDVRIDPDDA